ncbi:hypothetical protein HMN09_00346400 [Mycena chlorophos]|uniref:C2H2-type domain-containing protein n=1 Tax=Mycena chlorophos TaxID=658473 RepID=A0A8H6TIV5_MYCCL|nr:hypothetical protein HMN09_00346400 [Mycena chlorophos]
MLASTDGPPAHAASQPPAGASSEPFENQADWSQTRPRPPGRHFCPVPTCGRAFTTSGHVQRHARTHTGERKHACPFPGCGTRCSRADNLQQHYRIHLSPSSRRRTAGGRKVFAAPMPRRELPQSSVSPSAGTSNPSSVSVVSSPVDSQTQATDSSSSGQPPLPWTPPNSPPPLEDSRLFYMRLALQQQQAQRGQAAGAMMAPPSFYRRRPRLSTAELAAAISAYDESKDPQGLEAEGIIDALGLVETPPVLFDAHPQIPHVEWPPKLLPLETEERVEVPAPAEAQAAQTEVPDTAGSPPPMPAADEGTDEPSSAQATSPMSPITEREQSPSSVAPPSSSPPKAIQSSGLYSTGPLKVRHPLSPLVLQPVQVVNVDADEPETTETITPAAGLFVSAPLVVRGRQIVPSPAEILERHHTPSTTAECSPERPCSAFSTRPLHLSPGKLRLPLVTRKEQQHPAPQPTVVPSMTLQPVDIDHGFRGRPSEPMATVSTLPMAVVDREEDALEDEPDQDEGGDTDVDEEPQHEPNVGFRPPLSVQTSYATVAEYNVDHPQEQPSASFRPPLSVQTVNPYHMQSRHHVELLPAPVPVIPYAQDYASPTSTEDENLSSASPAPAQFSPHPTSHIQHHTLQSPSSGDIISLFVHRTLIKVAPNFVRRADPPHIRLTRAHRHTPQEPPQLHAPIPMRAVGYACPTQTPVPPTPTPVPVDAIATVLPVDPVSPYHAHDNTAFEHPQQPMHYSYGYGYEYTPPSTASSGSGSELASPQTPSTGSMPFFYPQHVETQQTAGYHPSDAATYEAAQAPYYAAPVVYEHDPAQAHETAPALFHDEHGRLLVYYPQTVSPQYEYASAAYQTEYASYPSVAKWPHAYAEGPYQQR